MKLSETFNFERPSMGKEVPQEQETSFQRMREMAKNRNPEKYRELEEMLGGVDFNILQGVLKNLASRCGVKPENFNVIDEDRITLFYSSKVAGVYFIDTNSIGLNTDQIKKSSEYVQKQDTESMPEGDYFKLSLLHTLIHEEVHAISYRHIAEDEAVGQKGRISGYRASIYDNDNWSDFYTALDEGVTEMIARQLLEEYMKKDPKSVDSQSLKRFLNTLESYPSGYDVETTLVSTLIQKIAKTSGMSEETVRQGIIRSKLEGVDLTESEFAEFMDEHTYTGFSDDIKKLKPAQEYDEIEKTHSCLSNLDPDWAKKRQEEKRRNSK